MTRINLVAVESLTDQHLMAEYRELPMVLGSSKRSNPEKHMPTIKYVLGKGHVSFFYNKKAFLIDRYERLIRELYKRKFNISPYERNVDFSVLDKFVQNRSWSPTQEDIALSFNRIEERIKQKPTWYRYCGVSLIIQ